MLIATMRSNSISSISSVSSSGSSASSEETMQIFVKNIAGDSKHLHENSIQGLPTNSVAAFAITVPKSTSVSTLTQLMALRTNIPQDKLRIVFAGKHLTNASAPLTDYNITREAMLHLALPVRGGAPKKVRCQFKDCKDAAQRIVGDCGFCSGHFCGKHRMLESHACSGLENCKEEEKQRNKARLESERTVAIKGI